MLGQEEDYQCQPRQKKIRQSILTISMSVYYLLCIYCIFFLSDVTRMGWGTTAVHFPSQMFSVSSLKLNLYILEDGKVESRYQTWGRGERENMQRKECCMMMTRYGPWFGSLSPGLYFLHSKGSFSITFYLFLNQGDLCGAYHVCIKVKWLLQRFQLRRSSFSACMKSKSIF